MNKLSNSFHDAANYAASFLPPATEFSKNALEGALLTGALTIGPHIFNKYVDSSFPLPMDLPTALAWTATGAVAYSTYKTALKPASNKAYDNLSSIPRQVSDFSGSLFADKDDKEVQKKSLYSLSLWRLGMLSSFGYLYSQTSKLPGFDQNPAYPIVASAAGTLVGSWALNKGIMEGYKAISKPVEDIVGTTSEAVQNMWDFGTTALKAGAIGLGIVGAGAIVRNLSSVLGSKPMTVGAQGANTVLDASMTVINWGAKKFAFAFDKAAQGAGVLSGLVFRSATLKDCSEEAFKAQNEFLCANAERIEFAVNKATTYVINPASSALYTAGTNLYAASQSIGSALHKAGSFGVATAQNVGTFASEQMGDLSDSFTDPNGTGAWTLGKLGSAAQTTGSFAYTAGEKAGSAAYSTGSFLFGRAQDLKNFFTAPDATGTWAINKSVDIATNPTVQRGALITVAAGASLFAIHFLATKAKAYFAKNEAPVEPEHDIEMGPLEVGSRPAVTPTAPLLIEDAPLSSSSPAIEMPAPSAPEMTPEMIAELEGRTVQREETTLMAREVPLADAPIPVAEAVAAPAATRTTPAAAQRPSRTTGIWATLRSITSFVRSAMASIRAFWLSLIGFKVRY